MTTKEIIVSRTIQFAKPEGAGVVAGFRGRLVLQKMLISPFLAERGII
jgi:hypothetical protein